MDKLGNHSFILNQLLAATSCGGHGLACPPLADKHMVYQGRRTATWIWLAPLVLCLYGLN